MNFKDAKQALEEIKEENGHTGDYFDIKKFGEELISKERFEEAARCVRIW